MKRRDVIQKLTLGLGVSVTVPGVLQIAACTGRSDLTFDSLVFNVEQIKLIDELGETILPQTDTPGAKALNLTEFIDQMLHHVYDESGRKAYLMGLNEFDQKCRQHHGQSFADLAREDRHRWLADCEMQSPGVRGNIWGNPVGPETQPDFYRQTKSLLLLGYYTSAEIGRDVLYYKPVPGEQIGCRDLETGEKITVL